MFLYLGTKKAADIAAGWPPGVRHRMLSLSSEIGGARADILTPPFPLGFMYNKKAIYREINSLVEYFDAFLARKNIE